MTRNVSAGLLTLGWCLLIYSATASSGQLLSSPAELFEWTGYSLPSHTTGWIILLTRKLGHIAVFGSLGFLIWMAIPGVSHRWAWAWMLASLYGASDELHQAFIAGRTSSLADVGVNATGALIAVLCLEGLAKAQARRIALGAHR